MNYLAPESLPERLLRTRRRAAMRQVELATILNVSQSLVSQIERGRVQNNPFCLRAIRLLEEYLTENHNQQRR